MNHELPDVPAGFRRDRGKRVQIENIYLAEKHLETCRKLVKNIYFCFISYAKAFDCVDHNKLWKILRDRNTDDLTCILRNLYADQEATVRTGHRTMDWFKMGKGYVKAVYCHSAYLTYMQSTFCKMPSWTNH